MIELTKEEFEGLPEKAQGGFTELGGAYVPVKDAQLKSTLDNLDKEKRALEAKNTELTTAEAGRAAEIEAARAEARELAIKEAQEAGNWEQQEKLLREKFEDELNRNAETVRGEVTKEFAVKQANDLLQSDIRLLAAELAVDESATAALEVLIGQRAKLDENGNRNYFGDDGSALSITELTAFKAEVKNSPVLARLVKGETPSTGGLLNGGIGGGGAPTKKPSEMTTAERLELKSRDPAAFKQMFNL